MNLHHILLIYKITIVLYENIIHWKQRKLGELGSVEMNRRIFKDQTSEYGDIPFYKIGTFGKIPDSFITRQLFKEYKSKYPYPNIGDLLLSASGSIGKIVEYTGADEYFQDSNIVWLKHDNNLANSFLKQFYTFVKWQGLEGSTIKRLYNKNILSTKINLPTINEQEIIGDFFLKFDQTITLHQQKLDKLLLLKKAYLQQLFPENGQNVPNVRFANFTDDWKQRKLGDYVIDYIEKTTVQNQFPVLTSSQQRGIIFQEDYFSNRQVTTDSNIGYFVLPRGFFTFRSRSDNDIFVFNRNDIVDKGIISYFYPVFTLKSANSDFFLKRVNNGIQCQISIQAEGTGQHVLSLKKFKNILAKFPGEKEQNQIGNFFKQLDNTIALQQNKLLKLKKVKKAYLQKLFI
jgi:type I restriction enzyme S subunit